MNKILGVISVVIMIVAMGYLVVSESRTDTKAQADNSKTEQTNTTSATEESTEKATKKATSSDLPDVKLDDWSLVLVGPDHKIEREIDEANQLAALDNGYLIDKRIKADYEELANAAKAAGFPLVMVSAYRSVATQREVFAQNVQQVMSSQGVTEEEATAITKKTMTEPGYSEHHTGLAVDVVDETWYNNYPNTVLDEKYGDEPGAKWLADNASKYGFIIRYPKGREDITKITYEPWHLRYVGKESAEYITSNDLTMEEYLDQLKEK
ncbi:M15 family metallopeptidase [Enterococcus mundtii]|uniref:M15 family metallopeptidase n=1 Tax=Enterococcus TaxID=1350 RepID=UPI000F7CFD5A|nr:MULTISPECIES: M15 family metallopeptidase [Enterococcus]AZP92640.1 peptidase M15 [Enterococcus mundtii]MDA9429463.1 D-alanyl-D-alanine carboxypeptidase [Enterococcus mundtii 1A]MDK4211683.1 M15 family metallopeptidase [Enterococcus mundtii]MEC3941170.1 M15 family metallopeptidase [Enterococcus mundtii]